jgi:transcriptional regulator with XRE-family HTH domain
MVRPNVTNLTEQQAALGLALGMRRKMMKVPLKVLSSATDLSPSHLSRFLSGKRSAAPAAAQRIASEVQMLPTDFVWVSGRLPDMVITALVEPAFAYALMDLDYRLPSSTAQVLRRASIAEMIDRIYPDPGRRDLPNPGQILSDRGYAVEVEAGEKAPRLSVDRMAVKVVGSDEAAVRFVLAHTLGHLDIEGRVECDFGRQGSTEADANSFAAYFLVRQRRLELEISLARRIDLWSEGAIGALITDVAGRIQVPEWLLTLRLADGIALGSAAAGAR